jgi:hypothetical protein
MNLIEAWEAQKQGKQIYMNNEKILLTEKNWQSIETNKCYLYHQLPNNPDFSIYIEPLTADELRKGMEYIFNRRYGDNKIYVLIRDLLNNERIWDEEK